MLIISDSITFWASLRDSNAAKPHHQMYESAGDCFTPLCASVHRYGISVSDYYEQKVKTNDPRTCNDILGCHREKALADVAIPCFKAVDFQVGGMTKQSLTLNISEKREF